LRFDPTGRIDRVVTRVGSPRAVVAGGCGLALLAGVFFVWRLVWHGEGVVLANSDLLLYFYPLYEATYARMRAGVLPLWNPYQLCGLPWLAPLQVGAFYPGHVLYLVLPTHLALALTTLLHFVFIALTTAAFARRVGLSLPAALVAAMLFTLRGTITHLTLFPNSLEAAAWLPLGGIAVLDLLDGDVRRGTLLLAVATAASFLAGYPQTTVFLLYAWGTLFVALLPSRRPTVKHSLLAAALLGAACALGALAAAVQLLPGAELARAGTREAHLLPPDLMFPMGGPFIGNPILHILLATGVTGSQFSFGVVGLSLLPAAVSARRLRALALWALVFGAWTFTFAIGPITPLFRYYILLPLLGWFRLPSRIFLLTDFCFAMLSAIGLDAVLSTAARRDGRLQRVGIVLAILASLALGGLELSRGRWSPAVMSLGFAGAVMLAGERRSIGAAVLVALVAVECLAAPSPGLLRPYGARVVAMYRPLDSFYEALVERAGHERVWIYSPGFFMELGPKQPTHHALRAVDDYEPVNLRRQSEFFDYLTDGTIWASRHFQGGLTSLTTVARAAPIATRRRLLDLAGMRFFATPTPELEHPEVASFVAAAGLVPVASGIPEMALFENPHAVPRAFVVYRTRAAPSPDEVLPMLSDGAFDPLVESFIEGDPGSAPASDAPPRGAAVTFVEDGERRVELDATLAAPGLVVLDDSYYPGWQATVDGVPAVILPTNHLFRGVPVPAGRHRVRFEYRPTSVTTGAVISAAALGVLSLVLLIRRSRPVRTVDRLRAVA
jgi:hypothetical protein